MKYTYLVSRNTCYIYEGDDRLLGWIKIDEIGAIVPHYNLGVDYLPLPEAMEQLIGETK